MITSESVSNTLLTVSSLSKEIQYRTCAPPLPLLLCYRTCYIQFKKEYLVSRAFLGMLSIFYSKGPVERNSLTDKQRRYPTRSCGIDPCTEGKPKPESDRIKKRQRNIQLKSDFKTTSDDQL